MTENLVEIHNKTYVCPDCKSQNIRCPSCKNVLKDPDFYCWLILKILQEHDEVYIRFSQNASNKAAATIELFKGLGLTEEHRKIIKIKCFKIELACVCSNILTLFIEDDANISNYACRKCGKKQFSVVSKTETKKEKTEVFLQKISAVRAMRR